MHTVQIENVKNENVSRVWIPVLFTSRVTSGEEWGKTYHLKPQSSQIAALARAKEALYYHPQGIGFTCEEIR